MAAVAFYADWNWTQALQECARAIDLDPEFSEPFHLRAKILNSLNRTSEAIQSEHRAMELNPFARPWALAAALNNARQYDAAIAEAKARLESDRADPGLLWQLEISYRCKGMENDAMQMTERAYRLAGETSAADATARAFERGGYQAVVQARLANRQKQSILRYVSPVLFARLTAQMHDQEKTLSLLEQAYDEHSPLLLDIQFDPAYDFLQSDQRYRSLLKKIGLPPASQQ